MFVRSWTASEEWRKASVAGHKPCLVNGASPNTQTSPATVFDPLLGGTVQAAGMLLVGSAQPASQRRYGEAPIPGTGRSLRIRKQTVCLRP
jgi:hypothetical protein